MDPSFIGRDRELSVLAELFDSGRPEFFVLYGRRRVGKTELLQRFCTGRRAVYFLAAQVRDKDNLAAFQRALKEGTGDPLLDTIEFPDWPAALGYAAERAKSERLVVVLDEFPYLCEANKGLPSLLQGFWDTTGKRSNLMLVLCGSQVSFMEKEVLAEQSPLFGRRTGQRRLEPLRPPEALAFFDGWTIEERLASYAILGGMPAYLNRFSTRRSMQENVLAEILRPEGYLFDEVSFLLRSELSQPATYNSILRAVSGGEARVGEVALSVGVDSTTANKYLSVLRELGLVERQVPLTDPDPLRSRRGTYRIRDRFLAFHARHVQPHLSLIEAGRGSKVWDQHVQPDLERLCDDALVDFALDHLEREAGELFGLEVLETGRHAGECVRALGRLENDVLVAGICVPGGGLDREALDAELVELRKAAPKGIELLRYSLGKTPEQPLRIERPKRD